VVPLLQEVAVATPNTPHHMSRLELESIGRVLGAIEGAGEIAHDLALDVARGPKGSLLSTNIGDLMNPIKVIEDVADRRMAGMSQTMEAKRIAGVLDLAKRKAGFEAGATSMLSHVAGDLKFMDVVNRAMDAGVDDFGPQPSARQLQSPFLRGTQTAFDLVEGPDAVARKELLRSGFSAPFSTSFGDDGIGFLRTGRPGAGERAHRLARVADAMPYEGDQHFIDTSNLSDDVKKQLAEIKKSAAGKLPGMALPATKRGGGGVDMVLGDLKPVLRFPTEEQSNVVRRTFADGGKPQAFGVPDIKVENGKITPGFTYESSKSQYFIGANEATTDLPTKTFKNVTQDEVGQVVRAVRETSDLKYHLTVNPGDPTTREMKGYLERHTPQTKKLSGGRFPTEVPGRNTAASIRQPSIAELLNLATSDEDFKAFKADVDANYFNKTRGQPSLYGRLRAARRGQGPVNMQAAAKQLVKDLEKIRALNLSPEAVYLGLQASRNNMESTNSALGILRMAGPEFEGKRTALESKFAQAGKQVADDAATKFRSSLRALIGPSAAVAEGVLGEDLSKQIAATFANSNSPKELAERLQAVRRQIMVGQVRAIRATYPEPELQRYHIRNMVNRFANVLPTSAPGEDDSMTLAKIRQLVSEPGSRSQKKLTSLEVKLRRLGLREGQGLGMYLEGSGSPVRRVLDQLDYVASEAKYAGVEVPEENKKLARLMKLRLENMAGADLAREADLATMAGKSLSDAELGRRQFLGKMMKAAGQATPQTRAALEAAGAIQGYVDPAAVNLSREAANSQVLKGVLSFIRKFPGVP
jgi:hypothetical protein